ncbi:MAG: hypothetical protein QXX84_08325 [Sulfolobales archaeon]|jgi:hypothetical protein
MPGIFIVIPMIIWDQREIIGTKTYTNLPTTTFLGGGDRQAPPNLKTIPRNPGKLQGNPRGNPRIVLEYLSRIPGISPRGILRILERHQGQEVWELG